MLLSLTVQTEDLPEDDSELPRHALEVQALTAPAQVLKAIPTALQRAGERNDDRELALLHLARANACRMVADWQCQRSAGAQARQHADLADDAILAIRGLIAEARARMALQDYSHGERLLGEAELRLQRSPSAELKADVMLAYSSLSSSLGKHELCLEYADRGLAELAPGVALGMRVRLLRNRARAQTLLGELAGARSSLDEGLAIARVVIDPKLRAELHLEAARLARTGGDRDGVERNTARALELATELKNSQLAGLAFELRGLAAMDAGDREFALVHLASAQSSFRELGLERDELRTLRELIAAHLKFAADDLPWSAMLKRMLELENTVSQLDRASASDDFDARLKYAEQALGMVRLEAEAALAREREHALRQRNRSTVFLVLLAIAVVLVMAIYYAAQRRSHRRLQAALDARLRALTQTSHELRNPISGVLGLSELLLKTPINAAQRSMVEAIRSAGSTIEKLARDLLDRGRIESGRLSLSLQPTCLQLLAESVHQLHLPRAREKGLTLQLDLGPDLPEMLMADAERLQQVLSNLLGNSLKFTERGAINLSLRQRGRGGDGRIRVSFAVRDTGPGIDPDELASLFQPFAKGRAGQRHRSGAGLGLAISSDLVRLMGGQIQVDSTPGKGAQFRFELAFAACDSPAETTQPFSRSHGSGLKVLMVDDDEDVVLALRSQLEVLECEIDQAASSQAARNKVAACRYDLVLLDFDLPDGQGAELARSLRALEPNMQGTRIAIVSGHQAPKALPPGVDEWLTKPVLLDRLNMLLATTRVTALTERVA
ncbi:MAG: response regulator [Xanthomonadales bacterium]|nr:Sensor histidine kinase RcsC [Xanthomonadales bacterium]MCC6594744.1 response regulator [Xanthomonadales bacterium]MCE7932455.1 response regulator [Xanthomonadales bacterium PRO6]